MATGQRTQNYTRPGTPAQITQNYTRPNTPAANQQNYTRPGTPTTYAPLGPAEQQNTLYNALPTTRTGPTAVEGNDAAMFNPNTIKNLASSGAIGDSAMLGAITAPMAKYPNGLPQAGAATFNPNAIKDKASSGGVGDSAVLAGLNNPWRPTVAPSPRDVSLYAPTPAWPAPEVYNAPGVPELDTSGGGLYNPAAPAQPTTNLIPWQPRANVPGAGGPGAAVAGDPGVALEDGQPAGNMFVRSMGAAARSPVEYAPQAQQRAAPMAAGAQQSFFAPIGMR